MLYPSFTFRLTLWWEVSAVTESRASWSVSRRSPNREDLLIPVSKSCRGKTSAQHGFHANWYWCMFVVNTHSTTLAMRMGWEGRTLQSLYHPSFWSSTGFGDRDQEIFSVQTPAGNWPRGPGRAWNDEALTSHHNMFIYDSLIKSFVSLYAK